MSWYGRGPQGATTPGSEACIQALSGLMELHGRDSGRPRRLGLEVASVAAGILATQGVLAGMVARGRGMALSAVHTSVLEAGCQIVTPYVAMASTAGWTTPPPASTPGPPFPTMEGHWVEIEVLDPADWLAFWSRFGLDGPLLGRAWHNFLNRYETATCALPPELFAVTSRQTLAELTAAAAATGVTLCRLRSPAEVASDRPAPPWRIDPTAVPGAPLARAQIDDRLPLAGLKVVEATRRTQGPLAGHFLQLLGADVIRIESPGGDLTRGMPPLAGDMGAVFLAFNRGKRALELDLKRPAGRAELLALVASADVFLHNWRPGRAAELALDAEDCAAANPALVYAQASGWGGIEGHPVVGTDFLVQATAAMGHFLSPPDEAPFPTRLVVADVLGALVAAEAVLAGLVLRQSSGRGCRLESSLLGATMSLEAHVLDAVASGREAGRLDGRPLWGPFDRPLDTADGLLSVTVSTDEDRARLGRVCGATWPGEATIVERLRHRPAQHWEDVLLAAGIPAAVVCRDLSDLGPGRLGDLLDPAEGCFVPAAPWQWVP